MSPQAAPGRTGTLAGTYSPGGMTEGHIDPYGAEHVYMQLAAILRARIQRGDYPRGRALPARDRLASEFGVSKGSVERALTLLRREGLVRTTVGRGVYVL